MVNVWSVEDGSNLATFQDLSCINCLFIWDSDRIIVSVGSVMNIWSISSKKIIKKLDYHSKKVQKIIKFGKNEIATCGFDSKIYIYDLQKECILHEIRTQTNFIRDFIFIQDSIICCGDDSKIEIYSYNTKQSNYTDLSVIPLDENLTKIVSDGVLIIGIGRKIHIIEWKTKKILFQVPAHSGSIEDLMLFGHLFV
jgi:WD40 repeat protein